MAASSCNPAGRDIVIHDIYNTKRRMKYRFGMKIFMSRYNKGYNSSLIAY